jgi:8-oxo-dGTP pyrophosphatase MutT (NUDIX family)
VVRRYVVGFLLYGPEVLLIRKRRPEWQRGLLNGIGGHIEPTDASPLHAMRREFAEEAGFPVSDWEHFLTLVGDDRDAARQGTLAGSAFEVWFFRAREDVVVTPLPSPTDERTEWVNVATLHEYATVPNLRWLLPLTDPRHRADWPLLVVERTTLAYADSATVIADIAHPEHPDRDF